MDSIWSYIMPRLKKGDEKDIEVLDKTSIFADLPIQKKRRLLRLLHRRYYKPAEIVFSVGEPGVGLYIVCEGEVGVFIPDPHQPEEEKRETQIATLKEGEIFGDVALFATHIRTATIKALKPTRLLGMVRPEFLNLLKQDPEMGGDIMLRLLTLLSKRLEFTNHQLLEAKNEINMLRGRIAFPESMVVSHTQEITDPFRSNPSMQSIPVLSSRESIPAFDEEDEEDEENNDTETPEEDANADTAKNKAAQQEDTKEDSTEEET